MTDSQNIHTHLRPSLHGFVIRIYMSHVFPVLVQKIQGNVRCSGLTVVNGPDEPIVTLRPARVAYSPMTLLITFVSSRTVGTWGTTPVPIRFWPYRACRSSRSTATD